MKNHLIVKAIAVFLCALSLLVAVSGGIMVLVFAAMGVSDTNTADQIYMENVSNAAKWSGMRLASRYAARNLGGFTDEMINSHFGSRIFFGTLQNGTVYYTIYDDSGYVLETTYHGTSGVTVYTIDVPSVEYMKVDAGPVYTDSWQEAESLLDAMEKKEPAARGTDLETAAVMTVNPGQELMQVSDMRNAFYRVHREIGPDLTVVLYAEPDAIVKDTGYDVVQTAWNYRNYIMAAMGVSLVFFAVGVIYLCCAAGHTPGSDEIRAGGLNRTPLDLYALVTGGVILTVVYMGAEGAEYLVRQGLAVAISAYGYAGFLCCLLLVGFCFAFVAQIKSLGWGWIRNTLFVRCFFLFIKLGKNAWHLGIRFLKFLWMLIPRLIRDAFKILRSLLLPLRRFVGRIVGFFYGWIGKLLKRINYFYSMLPLTWQWLLIGGCMPVVLIIGFATRRALWALVAVFLCAVITIYGANSFGMLLKSTKRMREGDLEAKIDDSLLVGSFREFAGELNGVAEVAVIAAQNQMKSERMKTELITNVSHDIKTPLTSIINYANLLSMPHTPEQEKMYLETLSRQSMRMKKLIEDLIEMSKASTGNMTVEITRVDAVEAVNQALGEFCDKLDAAQLTPVYHPPEEEVAMYADGRLVWRAMSNILSNAVKYAMPGTRLYVDLSTMNDQVLISVKNVSRDVLNVDAEELLERFVRGDSSRNTEGSGLGLNIAKSLMELQHGELQLLVDGDLFKVTLLFPQA